jgi:transglutaminase-like putative cysteine protease
VIEVRRLAGVLLAWSVLPFPFLYIVMPPFWLAAAAVAGLLLAAPGRRLELSKTTRNVLGIVILVAVVAAGGLQVGPLRPLGHLLLLVTSVRAVSVADLRDLVRTLPAIFLVWLVAVANVTHVSGLPYLVVSAGVWWWAGTRIHLLAVASEAAGSPPRGPRLRHVVVAAALAALLAVPVFVAMPRLKSPWIAGRGSSTLTGFTSEVELNRVGSIQESHQPALLVRSRTGPSLREEWMRLRGTALDMVLPGSWTDRRRGIGDLEVVEGRVRLATGEFDSGGMVPIEIQMLEPQRFLFLPRATVAVDVSAPVRVDPQAGAVRLAVRLTEPLSYTAWVVTDAPRRLRPPTSRDNRLPHPDPDIARAAERVVEGAGDDPMERALRIERWLQDGFEYSLESSPGLRVDPVRWFLFESRSGHCEDFAAAMVVCLRHLGIPARMVAGYSGGTLSADGREALVRQSNAHSWVEAWMGPDAGWVEFDPTPADAVPSFGGPSGLDRLRWTWQRFEAGFDRWVLTFGFGEQMQLIGALGQGLTYVDRRHVIGLLLVVAAAAGLLYSWRTRRSAVSGHRRDTPAARAVRRVERRLGRAGVSVPERATPRWIGAVAASAWPPAADELHRLVGLAERELYGPGRAAADRAEVRRLERAIRAGRAPCPPGDRTV